MIIMWFSYSNASQAYRRPARSASGSHWTLHRIFTLRDPTVPVAIGFLAKAPTGETCTAHFSDIKFTPTTLANPRDGS